MNGQFLGCRSIRTNWASRKPPAKAEGKPIITFSYDSLRTFRFVNCCENSLSRCAVKQGKKNCVRESCQKVIHTELSRQRQKKKFHTQPIISKVLFKLLPCFVLSLSLPPLFHNNNITCMSLAHSIKTFFPPFPTHLSLTLTPISFIFKKPCAFSHVFPICVYHTHLHVYLIIIK